MVDRNRGEDKFPTEEERRSSPLNEDTGVLTIDPLTGSEPNQPREITRNLPDSNGGMTEDGTVFPVDDDDSSNPDNH